jgi:hypothetical protein
VNREVETRHGYGQDQGEQTVIHVGAVRRGPGGEVYDSVTAIIETKGCWNRELYQAMRTQLVTRYLQDNRTQHGLYLVGWFNCNQWDSADARKKRAPKLGTAEAQHQFDAQAAELSSQQGVHVKAFILNTALR